MSPNRHIELAQALLDDRRREVDRYRNAKLFVENHQPQPHDRETGMLVRLHTWLRGQHSEDYTSI